MVTISIQERGLNNFGRQKITCSLRENELTSANILLVLKDILPIHAKNAQDSRKLQEILKGNQEIYNKVKEVRADINNKVVENVLLHAVQFKVGYTFGEVQYIQKSNQADKHELDDNGEEKLLSHELSILNTTFENAEKKPKNKDLARTVYTSGVAPVYVYFTNRKDKPFEFHLLEPRDAFVCYSSGFRGERLFSVRLYVTKNYSTGEETLKLEVITKRNKYEYAMPYKQYLQIHKLEKADIAIEYLEKSEPIHTYNILGDIPIFEYTFNKDRLSLVEIGLDGQNALNKIRSADLDDIEQFVQNMTILIDTDIDNEIWRDAQKSGIIKLKTGENKQGSVQILNNKLKHSETNLLYEAFYRSLLTTLGIPLLGIGGGNDTGQARQTDNGWSMADVKAKEDEAGFEQSEKPMIEYVISLLKRLDLISDLSISNINIRFNRHKTDNLQSKAQAVQMFIASGVHPEIAFEIANVFGDSAEAYAKSFAFFGKDFYLKQQATDNAIKRQQEPLDVKEETPSASDEKNDIEENEETEE